MTKIYKDTSRSVKNKFFNKKFFLPVVATLLVVICAIIGLSYAYWRITYKQNDFNTLGVRCFDVTLTNEENDIRLENASPITDEEGNGLTPYTFTITNTCDTYAYYQVNLEDILQEGVTKRLSHDYIKVSLDGGTPQNYSKYPQAEPTLENADYSARLTSGTLAPAGSEGDSRSYALRLWMDYDTPPLPETMNASFYSKISVVASYIEEEKLNNDIVLAYESQTEGFTNEKETILITGTSTNYDIIEVSDDGVTFYPITPTKELEITKEYIEDGNKEFYVRDEVGNVEKIEISLDHLDTTVPEITITPDTDWGLTNSITIGMSDDKSGLTGYQITTTEEEPTEWKDASGSSFDALEEVSDNGDYYIWVKDSAGNITHQKVTVDHIDKIGPEVVIDATTGNGTISVDASGSSDTGSGIKQYEYSLDGTTYYPSETSEYTFTNVSHGSHTVYVRVTDNLGNQNVGTTEVNVVVTYTIVYNANGGTGAPESQTKTHGEDITLSSTVPTRSGGWRFLGWSKDSSAISATYSAGATFSENGNITLYAVWERITHTVTYNYSQNGGTSASVTTATVGEGDAISLSPTATKSGYTFLGWNTNANATSALSSLTMSTSNVTLYAIYRKTLTVTYKDGAGTTSNSAYAYNNATSASIKLLTPRTYQDGCGGASWNYVWTALGWSTGTTANGSVNYSSGQTITISSNMTLYGQYRKVVRVLYTGNGGSCTRTQSKDYYIYYNGNGAKTSATLKLDVDFTCSRSGYSWNRSMACDGTSGLKIRDYIDWSFYNKQCAVICEAEWK